METRATRYATWPTWTVVVCSAVGLFFAATIVLSLIPIFSTNNAKSTPISPIPLSLLYNLSADQLNIPLPLTTVPEPGLKFLEDDFQKRLDIDADTAGSTVQVTGAQVTEASGTKSNQIKRQVTTGGIVLLNITAQLTVKNNCRGASCIRRILQKITKVILAELKINLTDWANAILAGLTTTTTPRSVTSGGLPSISANPSSAPISGKRRRRQSRSFSPPSLSSHIPVAGALLISLNDPKETIEKFRHRYSFFNYLAQGIQHLPAVNGEDLDLYTMLREGKLSKESYDQLIRQDQLITGHNPTRGSLGCLESHVLAWEQVVRTNQPMLIIEDDVEFDQNLFDAMMPYLLYSLPSNFSLLYFGNLIGSDFQSKLSHFNHLLWKVNGSNWGTYAYLISPHAAAILLDFIYPAMAQVDSMIIDIAHSQSLDVYMSKQILVKTNNQYRRSSTTQRYLVPPIIIPRLFHFIWISAGSLPSIAEKRIAKWKEFHPEWDIRLWANDTIMNNSKLVLYNKDQLMTSSRSARQASDILRYDIIYQYGGVYLDLDFEPMKNIEPLLHGVEAFVVHENELFVCNGVFGMIPGHKLAERLVTRLDSSMETYKNATVNQQSGPYHMTREVNALNDEKVIKFAPHVFFPYPWYEKDPGPPYSASSYAVHHFRSIKEIEEDFREGH